MTHVWIVEGSVESNGEWWPVAVAVDEEKAEALAEMLRKELPDVQYRVAKYERADEALAAEHDCEMSRVVLVLEQFCQQCAEGHDPGACPDCLLRSLGGGKVKDSTRLTGEAVDSGSNDFAQVDGDGERS